MGRETWARLSLSGSAPACDASPTEGKQTTRRKHATSIPSIRYAGLHGWDSTMQIALGSDVLPSEQDVPFPGVPGRPQLGERSGSAQSDVGDLRWVGRHGRTCCGALQVRALPEDHSAPVI
jgi:hypothetical protein